MTQGIVFFNDWWGHCSLLSVAIHSLESHYSGNIHVMYGQHTPAVFQEALKSNKRITCESHNPNYSLGYWTRSCLRQCWSLKPVIHQYSPFDVTLMYDCDHVFVDQFDLSAFDLIAKHGLTSFHHPRQYFGRRWWRQADGRASVIRDVMKLPCPPGSLVSVNGGCVGSRKGTPLLGEWFSNMETFATCGNMVIVRLPDEFSLSYTLYRNQIPIGGDKWSYSPFANLSDLTPLPAISAIHFSNSSYRHGSYFAKALQSALEVDYMGLQSNWDEFVVWNPLIKESLSKLEVKPVSGVISSKRQ